MTLYIIGLGLSDEKDITLKGLEAIKQCEKVYLESYTSILNIKKEALEKLYEKEITLADREALEQKPIFLDEAKNKEIALLIIGDPLSATTHTDLILRAKEKNVKVKVIHNASVLTAIGETGLQLYNFGKTTSIPFTEKDLEINTPYEVLKQNQNLGMHTLFLLDLDPKNNKFMTIQDAIRALEKIENRKKENIITKDTLYIGCARLGSEDHIIKAGKAKDLENFDFGKPVHCLIIPGKMHFLEEDYIKTIS